VTGLILYYSVWIKQNKNEKHMRARPSISYGP
jgi:hypothetical protein